MLVSEDLIGFLVDEMTCGPYAVISNQLVRKIIEISPTGLQVSDDKLTKLVTELRTVIEQATRDIHNADVLIRPLMLDFASNEIASTITTYIREK